MPEISDSMHSAGALADALQDLLRQLIDKPWVARATVRAANR